MVSGDEGFFILGLVCLVAFFWLVPWSGLMLAVWARGGAQ